MDVCDIVTSLVRSSCLLSGSSCQNVIVKTRGLRTPGSRESSDSFRVEMENLGKEKIMEKQHLHILTY